MKTTVYAMIFGLVGSFGLVTYYGIRHSRGTPVEITTPGRAVLEVPYRPQEIHLAGGVHLEPWQSLPAIDLELMYQVTVLPWARSLVSPLTVQAFHNGRHIYFHLAWKDDSEDRRVGVQRFSDAAAIMFPLGDEVEPSTIMMGFMAQSNIWQWKASRDTEFWARTPPKSEAYADYHYPFEEEELFGVSREKVVSAVSELLAKRVGTVTPSDLQEVEGRGLWHDGVWHVVFRRAMDSADPQIAPPLLAGTTRLVAFAVWNGHAGDRGGRKSISEWVELRILPRSP